MDAGSTYNYKVVRQFAVMTVVWGVVGMLVGVIIAAQLIWPELNFNVPWLTYGRLRPLHTNAVIFAFGGSALFATSYYVVQRTCHTRLFSGGLAAFTFWGWQAIIVLAAVTLPLGYTSGKEYAELEWPIDILIALVWVAYAVVFFGTLAKRKIPHIYVANWFFGAFIITVAILHIVNSAAVPAGFWKSYSAYAGAQDAMVQWWYGHNAVGFFLTAGFLGMMYYFIPKQAGRPVYWWGARDGYPEGELRALGFAAIVFANVAMIHAVRSRHLTIVGSLRKPNAALWWITGGTLAALALAIYVPTVADIFRFAPLSAGQIAIAAAAGVAGIAWYEAYKLLRPRRSRM